MKKILLLVLFALSLSISAHAENTDVVISADSTRTAVSPANRVVLLELYTSEGCSSCPPADKFLSELKTAGISDKQLIPIAFHVTYWDYIGWKDPFANKQFDARQRDLASKKKKPSVYTPQFLLSGDDYRRFGMFSEDVNRLAAEKASISLKLSAAVSAGPENGTKLQINLTTDITQSEIKDVGFYLVIIENNLTSEVSDGENEGELLHHDYVVRQFLGPYFQSKPQNRLSREQTIILRPEWKQKDLSVVAFAENPHTGEVLQAVRLKY